MRFSAYFDVCVHLDSALSVCTLFLCVSHALLFSLFLSVLILNFVFPVFAETHLSRSGSPPHPISKSPAHPSLWVPLPTDHPADSGACEHTQWPGAAPQPSHTLRTHLPASEGPAALLYQVMAAEPSPGGQAREGSGRGGQLTSLLPLPLLVAESPMCSRRVGTPCPWAPALRPARLEQSPRMGPRAR